MDGHEEIKNIETSNKQQAMTSDKHAIGVFILGGARPQALTRLRQIVTCDNDSLDRQIDAGPAVQGHRRRHTHKLRKSNRCDTKANIFFHLKMRCFDIVNLTNGGKNGITIRLHGFGHRRLDQRATRHSSKFLLDHDGNRYERGYEGEPGRNCFPNNVSSDAGTWTMERAVLSGFCKRSGSWNDRLQMQRGTRSALQIYSKMDQGRGKLAGRKVGEERRHSETQKGCKIDFPPIPGQKWPGFFYAWKKDNRIKEQATSNMRQGAS